MFTLLWPQKEMECSEYSVHLHGGIALNMTVTGPDGYSSDLTNNIQPLGTQNRTGNDKYIATTSTSDINRRYNDRDMYQCTVTSSTSETGSVELRGEDHTLYLCSVNLTILFSTQLPMLQT